MAGMSFYDYPDLPSGEEAKGIACTQRQTNSQLDPAIRASDYDGVSLG